MVYAINLGNRVHNWNHVQVRKNLEFLANYRVYRYPTHKMGLLSHIFRALVLPFYSIRFNYTFGNNYHANQMLIQLRPIVANDYKLAILFNRLAPSYHLACLDLPQDPVVIVPSIPAPVQYVPTQPTYIQTPTVYHVPAPVIQPRRSFFSHIAPAFNFGGGRQVPGTGVIDLSTLHHTPLAPAMQPLATRNVTYVTPTPVPMRQIPGTDAITHSRPANAMRTLAPSHIPTRTHDPFTVDNTHTGGGRVAVGGRRR